MTLLDERPPLALDVPAEPTPSPHAKPAATPQAATPAAAATREVDRAAEKLLMLRRTRKSAVTVTVFIAAGSFGLSFYSLWDMASHLAWPSYIAWMWPLIVDGMIIVATMSLVAFGGYAGQKANVVYSWSVLVFGAVVSMGANFIHPLLPHMTGQAQGPVTAGMWLGAGMSCIPPVALLACSHLLARLWAFSPEDEEYAIAGVAIADPVVVDSAGAVTALSHAVAARIQAGGKLTSYPEEEVAEIVRLLFQTEPPLKLREIGRMVDRHHDVVGRVRHEVFAMLGVGMAAETAS